MNTDQPTLSTKSLTQSTLGLSIWCIVAAFGTYFCMYAFRKPFTAGAYDGVELWGMGYKSILVIAQVLGYTTSKFIGIKVVSEMKPHQRAGALLGLILFAELALLAFGLIPQPYNCVCLFFNGLPLGMVFGMVLGFLEGRKQTEAMTAGLCTSFILADGLTKSTGAYLLSKGISENWMPFCAGLFFVIPLCGFVWMLSKISAPNRNDIEARSERSPMDSKARRDFFKRYAGGLILIGLTYLLITILRSIRADFAPEIWKALGVKVDASMFTWTESIVGLSVLLVTGSAVLIKDNYRAFNFAILFAVTGAMLICGTLLAQHAGVLSPFAFMVLMGLGLYLPYMAVHTTIFERLIAMTRDRGNIGYLMSLVDAFGYLGYVMVLFGKSTLGKTEDFLHFIGVLSWIVALLGIGLLTACWRYFSVHPATRSGAVVMLERADSWA